MPASASASRHGDDDAFAGVQAVGLHHDRRAVLLHVGLGGLRIAKFREAGGRNLVRGAKLLGEGLGAFELRRDRLGAERLDAGLLQIVHQARDQRRFGADHHQVDLVRLAEGRDRRVVGDLEVDDLRFLGDARIARRRIELGQERARGELPGERMLASAGAEEQDLHGEIPEALRAGALM